MSVRARDWNAGTVTQVLTELVPICPWPHENRQHLRQALLSRLKTLLMPSQLLSAASWGCLGSSGRLCLCNRQEARHPPSQEACFRRTAACSKVTCAQFLPRCAGDTDSWPGMFWAKANSRSESSSPMLLLRGWRLLQRIQGTRHVEDGKGQRWKARWRLGELGPSIPTPHGTNITRATVLFYRSYLWYSRTCLIAYNLKQNIIRLNSLPIVFGGWDICIFVGISYKLCVSFLKPEPNSLSYLGVG